MRISVIGTGYLGAVHAAGLAEIGHEVLGMDIDQDKIAALSSGNAPFYEDDFEDMLVRNARDGRIRFTTSLDEAAAFADVHFLCVGTPQSEEGNSADLRQLKGVIRDFVPRIRKDSLLIGKSTVPVGTSDTIRQLISEHGASGVAIELAWNPEFLREGQAVHDTMAPDRIVAGVGSGTAEKRLRDIYDPLIRKGVPFFVTNIATAELVKMASNSFLATKLSFINAMSEICDLTGADVVHLAEAVGEDRRIGRSYFKAGLGFGGGCLPKDIRALYSYGQQANVGKALDFLPVVDEINLRCRERTVAAARRLCGGSLAGAAVAVLGAAFVPNSDDIRDSPALAVATACAAEGALVRVHDVRALQRASQAIPTLTYDDEVLGVCEGADVVLHLTDWREYQDLDPAEVKSVVARTRIFDARNALPADRWRAAGWTFEGIGRPNGGSLAGIA
ncbi:UDP-glucose/GDP-mannose dehydrogenase family protein [Streptomyces luomodiensis]|uniref:UDP-glucose 6-dehydrogenase n=1 Tax=Streptomyces luomodiensis TaxID=3026192 RepID=A0ABY9USG0_9ACTN|nr:UDP-glucose/GDP-mannose dehydrogenase family protein [Streptomyces sp. SCA4-21]WNE95502.1 UDP-glucose/GDP-mannose dehydrogenase family protein [Streptomyces sp. SCA4-21]